MQRTFNFDIQNNGLTSDKELSIAILCGTIFSVGTYVSYKLKQVTQLSQTHRAAEWVLGGNVRCSSLAYRKVRNGLFCKIFLLRRYKRISIVSPRFRTGVDQFGAKFQVERDVPHESLLVSQN